MRFERRLILVAVFLFGGALLLPREIASNHEAFTIPWGKTWKNKTKVTSSECRHYVDRKDFIGFEDVLPLCRLRKNIFQSTSERPFLDPSLAT